MQAVRFTRYGGPEVLELARVPVPQPKVGQVLIKVCWASVNAADYRMMRADPFLARFASGLRRPKRYQLGMDVAGVVVGDALAAGFAAGDRICGETFADGGGGFAEYAAVSAQSLAKVPVGVSLADAAAVPLAAVTALQAVRDKAGVQPGDEVLVHGAGGGVGLFAVQIARHYGGAVTAVCGPNSTAAVKAAGAGLTIDYTRADFVDGAGNYDVVLGVNGHRKLSDYRKVLRKGGRYVMVGGDNAQIFAALLGGKVRFIGSGKQAVVLTIDGKKRQDDLKQVIQWLADGTLSVTVAQTFGLAAVRDAIETAERHHTPGKLLIKVADC